jgi:hypothetical protein
MHKSSQAFKWQTGTVSSITRSYRVSDREASRNQVFVIATTPYYVEAVLPVDGHQPMESWTHPGH